MGAPLNRPIMPAPLRIILTPEEERTLSELRLAEHLPQRTRDRAHMLRLNAQGWNVPAIAEIFEPSSYCQSYPPAVGRTRIRGSVGSPRTGGKTQVASL